MKPLMADVANRYDKLLRMVYEDLALPATGETWLFRDTGREVQIICLAHSVPKLSARVIFRDGDDGGIFAEGLQRFLGRAVRKGY